MKLKTQLFLNTFLVIMLFILSYLLVFTAFQRVIKIQNLSHETTALRVTANEFQLFTDAVFLEKNEFSVLSRRWNDKALQLEEEIRTLSERSQSLNLPDQIQASFKSLLDGAEIQKGFREPFRQAALNILNEKELAYKVQFNSLYGYFLTLDQNDETEWRTLLKDLVKSVKAVNSSNNTLNTNLMILNERLDQYRQVLIKQTYRRILIMIGIISLFSIIYLNLFSRKLSGGFIILEQIMQNMAEHKLTGRAEMKGSKEMKALGSHINNVNHSFSTFIEEVRMVSEQSICLQDTLAAGTAETLAALQQISKNIETLEQAFKGIESDTGISENSVLAISTQINELNDNITEQSVFIENNLRSVEEISASIDKMSTLTEQGREKSSIMAAKLEENNSKADMTHGVILKVAKSIQDVMEITHIINEISDQTNILSMNAAIESAHAGEAGKGFAVVAEEIRILADSTAENAQQIDNTLKNVSQQITEAIKSSTESFESVEYMNTGLRELSSSLDEINNGMHKLSTSGSEIVSSSKSLNSITESITGSSENISDNTVAITNVVSKIKKNTEFASGNIEEIALGSKEIISTMKEVHSVSEDNKDGLNNLDQMINSFDTGKAPAAECLDKD
jgi:methyl-accepting chemotaxis protein